MLWELLARASRRFTIQNFVMHFYSTATAKLYLLGNFYCLLLPIWHSLSCLHTCLFHGHYTRSICSEKLTPCAAPAHLHLQPSPSIQFLHTRSVALTALPHPPPPLPLVLPHSSSSFPFISSSPSSPLPSFPL